MGLHETGDRIIRITFMKRWNRGWSVKVLYHQCLAKTRDMDRFVKVYEIYVLLSIFKGDL